MLSDIVDVDGGMVVRDGEIINQRITESVDGREPFAHAPMMTASNDDDDDDKSLSSVS